MLHRFGTTSARPPRRARQQCKLLESKLTLPLCHFCAANDFLNYQLAAIILPTIYLAKQQFLCLANEQSCNFGGWRAQPAEVGCICSLSPSPRCGTTSNHCGTVKGVMQNLCTSHRFCALVRYDGAGQDGRFQLKNVQPHPFFVRKVGFVSLLFACQSGLGQRKVLHFCCCCWFSCSWASPLLFSLRDALVRRRDRKQQNVVVKANWNEEIPVRCLACLNDWSSS